MLKVGVIPKLKPTVLYAEKHSKATFKSLPPNICNSISLKIFLPLLLNKVNGLGISYIEYVD